VPAGAAGGRRGRRQRRQGRGRRACAGPGVCRSADERYLAFASPAGALPLRDHPMLRPPPPSPAGLELRVALDVRRVAGGPEA
jgi:hypothetical protein